jgi:hypothetical protein
VSRTQVFVLLAAWLAIVLPMTLLGFGSDTDAWLVARNAERMWATGAYTASRTTGFPLHEILTTPFIRFGSWYASNLASLLFGVGLFAAVVYLGRRGRLSHPVLCLLSIAFLPAILVDSSSTMDYVFGLSTLTWAYVAMLEKKPVVSAVLIGVSVGFRPTNGLFIVPVAVYVYLKERTLSSILLPVVTAFVVGLVFYSPVLFAYGIRAPEKSINLHWDMKTRLLITGYKYLSLFGILQTMAIALIMLGGIWRWGSSTRKSPFLAFHATNIVLWTLLFLVLPGEPEYLLPIVLSVVFAADKLLNRTAFAALTVVILSFNLVQLDMLGGESGDRELAISVQPGQTVVDIQDRSFKMSTRRAATDYVADQATVLMYGATWIPTLNAEWVYDPEYMLNRQRQGQLYVSRRILDERQLRRLSDRGFRLVVWRGQKQEFVYAGKLDLLKYMEVIDSLDDFFGMRLSGRAINQR